MLGYIRPIRDGLVNRFHNFVLDRFVKSSMRMGFSFSPADLRSAKRAYLYGAGLKIYQLINFSVRPVAALATAAGGVAATLTAYVPKVTSKTSIVPTEIAEEHVATVMQPRTETVLTERAVDSVSYTLEPRQQTFVYEISEYRGDYPAPDPFNATIMAQVDIPDEVAAGDKDYGQATSVLFLDRGSFNDIWYMRKHGILYLEGPPSREFTTTTDKGLTGYVVPDGYRVFRVERDYHPEIYHFNSPVHINDFEVNAVTVASTSSEPITSKTKISISPSDLVEHVNFIFAVSPERDFSDTEKGAYEVMRLFYPKGSIDDDIYEMQYPLSPVKVTELVPTRFEGDYMSVEHHEQVIQQVPITHTVYEPVEVHSVDSHIVNVHQTSLAESLEFVPLRFLAGMVGIAGAAAYFTWSKLCERYMTSPRFETDLEARLTARLPAAR